MKPLAATFHMAHSLPRESSANISSRWATRATRANALRSGFTPSWSDKDGGSYFLSLVQQKLAYEQSLPCPAKAVLVALAWFANDQGKSCYPTLRTLQRYVGLSRQSVIDQLRTLEVKKLITVFRQMNRNGNSYELTLGTVKDVDCSEEKNGQRQTRNGQRQTQERSRTLTRSVIDPCTNREGDPNPLSASELISLEKELEAIQHRMSVIRGNYSGFQSWCADDQAEYPVLKVRRDAIKVLLGRRY